jgi:hypothetical protein
VIAFRKLFPCLAIGAFLIGTANEARCDLVYGTPVIQSGQGESGFAGIEFVPGGVCYSDQFLGFFQPSICAAGIPSEPTITYHYGVPVWLQELIQRQDQPTCIVGCDVPPVVEPIPEPASLGLVLIAFGLMLLPRRWKVTRR